MRDITLEELLEAGCHFGHQVNRRNPRADEFIFEARSNINIINLEKTREGLLEAAKFIEELSRSGGKLVLVGTKKQASTIIEEEMAKAKEAGTKNLYYVTKRWVGGILTNISAISKNFKKLDEINKILEGKSEAVYTKREMLLFQREKAKLEELYKGICEMPGEPDALFIIDVHKEQTAVSEARRLGVKTVGIVDTNADPSDVNYAIPANDDAVGSIKAITSYIVDAWIEGQKEVKSEKLEVKNKGEENKEPQKEEKEIKKIKKTTKSKKEEK